MHNASDRESETEAAFRKTMNPFFLAVITAVVILGVWHMNLALQAIFRVPQRRTAYVMDCDFNGTGINFACGHLSASE
jgi:hypothetical protein